MILLLEMGIVLERIAFDRSNVPCMAASISWRDVVEVYELVNDFERHDCVAYSLKIVETIILVVSTLVHHEVFLLQIILGQIRQFLYRSIFEVSDHVFIQKMNRLIFVDSMYSQFSFLIVHVKHGLDQKLLLCLKLASFSGRNGVTSDK